MFGSRLLLRIKSLEEEKLVIGLIIVRNTVWLVLREIAERLIKTLIAMS